jgi:hypothetical protein
MAIIDSKGRPVSRQKKSQTPARAMLTADEERAQLIATVTAAVKTDRKQFGRCDCARVAAAILPSLNATQVAFLMAGAFGEPMARAVSRIRQMREP